MNYDFPVSLQPTYTKSGKEVPGRRVVVRDDTDDPIAAVSTKYRLIEHKSVMEPALEYIKGFGDPIVNFHVGQKGARAIGEFTFRENTVEVRKGEMIGLRVYVDNTYNAKGSLKVKVGGLCLWCLNGAVNFKGVFDLNMRHTGAQEIKFPSTDELYESFRQTAKGFKQLASIALPAPQYTEYVAKAVQDNIISESTSEKLQVNDPTAWGMYNAFTYHITHKESDRATAIGKINRLTRVDRWFAEQFH